MKNNLFKILIVDDEPEARNLLRSLLSEIKNVEVVGEADNSERALYLIVEHYPNLILMDINMPGKTGMELVSLMKKSNVGIPVVFISAFKEYAIDAIRNEVYNFILKPVSKDELHKVIERHKRMRRKDLASRLMEVLSSIKEETKIRINSRHSYILINPSEIVYCSSEDGYSTLYLTNGKTEVSNSSLTQIMAKLKGHDFFHLGRSKFININYIRAIDKALDKCHLTCNENTWEVTTSHKSIKKLLTERFNHA